MTYTMKDTDQKVKLFHYDPESFELTYAELAFIPAGTGIPAASTNIVPPEVEQGKVLVFSAKDSTWSQLENHRGKVVYRKEDGHVIQITELGALPDGITNVPSPNVPNGYVARFKESTMGWEVLQDFRGIKVYQKSDLAEKLITDLGPWPDGFVAITPPDKLEGFAIIWNEEGEKWDIIRDLRGTIIYNIETGEKATVSELGQFSADYTTVEPPKDIPGHKNVYDTETKSWSQPEDHIGEKIYRKDDGSQETVTGLGSISDEFTTIAPTSQFDVWKDDKWEKDLVAEKASLVHEAYTRKQNFLAEVNANITILSDATDPDVMGEDINQDDVSRLKVLKKLRVDINRINPDDAPDITWPEEA